jgi:hypothetical protein
VPVRRAPLLRRLIWKRKLLPERDQAVMAMVIAQAAMHSILPVLDALLALVYTTYKLLVQ